MSWPGESMCEAISPISIMYLDFSPDCWLVAGGQVKDTFPVNDELPLTAVERISESSVFADGGVMSFAHQYSTSARRNMATPAGGLLPSPRIRW